MARVRSLIALLALAALAMTGCEEDPAGQAHEAFEAGKFGAARVYAARLAEADDPRGHELMALMAAQGLGGSHDFALARHHADEARAHDPRFAYLDDLIAQAEAATASAAERAFNDGRYRRALDLATVLTTADRADADRLIDRLYGEQRIALPGSALSWQDYWHRCSGNIRNEGDPDPDQPDCLGLAVVWDGRIAGRRGDKVLMKMEPGRLRARADLVLEMADDPPPDLVKRGAKVRFSGTTDGPGDRDRPDRLRRARLLGPGWQTRAERARAQETMRGRVADLCRDLATRLFKGDGAPPWVRAMRESAQQGLFYLVDVTSGAERYRRGEDGRWRGRMEGFATVQGLEPRETKTGKFIADCQLIEVRDGARGPVQGTLSLIAAEPPQTR